MLDFIQVYTGLFRFEGTISAGWLDSRGNVQERVFSSEYFFMSGWFVCSDDANFPVCLTGCAGNSLLTYCYY